MSWVKVYEGVVMGDEITIERYVDEDYDGEPSIKVTAKDKNPPQLTPPIIEGSSVIIPLAPQDPMEKYTFEYNSISDMYDNFAQESGRPHEFTKALADAIQNA